MRIGRPEVDELLEIPIALHLLPSHGAVHRDLVPDDVLQDAVVGGRCPPNVVFGLQTVVETTICRRGMLAHSGNRPHRAGDDLAVDAPAGQDRKNLIELPKPDQWFAAHYRNVQGLVLVDQLHEAIDELLPFVVADLTQRDLAAQMFIAVGATPRASQRALASDLDRQRGTVSTEDTTPRGDDSFHQATISFDLAAPAFSRVKDRTILTKRRYQLVLPLEPVPHGTRAAMERPWNRRDHTDIVEARALQHADHRRLVGTPPVGRID